MAIHLDALARMALASQSGGALPSEQEELVPDAPTASSPTNSPFRNDRSRRRGEGWDVECGYTSRKALGGDVGDSPEDPLGPEATHGATRGVGARMLQGPPAEELLCCLEVVSLLGEGNYGEVYKAVVTAKPSFPFNHSSVAVKGFKSEGGMATAHIEAAVLTQLSMVPSPCINIVQGIAWHQSMAEGSAVGALVMEFVRGCNLKQQVKQHGRLKLASASTALSGVVKALVAIAALPDPVIHRDVKPHNIMLTEQNGMLMSKLCDFGLAIYARQVKDGVQAMGTPGYVAPEVARGHMYDCSSDVFSAGCCLYFGLSGHHPFGFDAETWNDNLHNSLRPISDTVWARRELGRDATRRLMEEDPSIRGTALDALALDFFAEEGSPKCCAGDRTQTRSADWERKMESPCPASVGLGNGSRTVSLNDVATAAQMGIQRGGGGLRTRTSPVEGGGQESPSGRGLRSASGAGQPPSGLLSPTSSTSPLRKSVPAFARAAVGHLGGLLRIRGTQATLPSANQPDTPCPAIPRKASSPTRLTKSLFGRQSNAQRTSPFSQTDVEDGKAVHTPEPTLRLPSSVRELQHVDGTVECGQGTGTASTAADTMTTPTSATLTDGTSVGGSPLRNRFPWRMKNPLSRAKE